METVRLEQRGVDVRLGKRLDTRGPSPDAIRMSDVVKLIPGSALTILTTSAGASVLPNVPATGWGWGLTFGAANWGMDVNGPGGPGSNLPPDSDAFKNGAGDCWWAMFVHRLRMEAKLAGRPIPQVSDLTLITQYAAYIASVNNGHGYDLQTGANDLGTDPLGAYKFLETEPFKDDAGNTYPVSKVISLTPGDVQQHLVGTRLFEGVGVGVSLQQAQVDQFDQDKPLAYVKGSPVVGGHELLQAGPNGMIEWGARIPFDPSFIERCNDQSEATISVEMFNAATGKDATDASEIDVEEYVSAYVEALGV
jgi:hypothetical protein